MTDTKTSTTGITLIIQKRPSTTYRWALRAIHGERVAEIGSYTTEEHAQEGLEHYQHLDSVEAVERVASRINGHYWQDASELDALEGRR